MNKTWYWFRNVFWYHYRWHTIGALCAVFFVVYFTVSMVTKETPDFCYMLVADELGMDLPVDEWDGPAAEILGDLNGDGKVVIYGLMLGFSNSEMGMASRVKFFAEMTNEELLLIVMDEKLIEEMGDMAATGDGLMPLADLGLPSEAGRPWLVRVEPPPLFRAIGVERDFYLFVKALTPEKRERPEVRARFEQAAKFAKMLLEMSNP